jgi:hypothetical protein
MLSVVLLCMLCVVYSECQLSECNNYEYYLKCLYVVSH